ncbi:uncharacterized protein TNCT_717581 [Trichonephila clavata]|uniref:Uncharacterized protein n=1 Tax=Trichonephila clavata TaxID=2740835 RepID=A0A8X6F305_TRICU|nr:uncharacterized protein TNCT_717581 [Trichonephila clavata]
MLPEIHKTSQIGTTLRFLSRYPTDEENFLDRIMTGDETWVPHVKVETKQQSMAWVIPVFNPDEESPSNFVSEEADG